MADETRALDDYAGQIAALEARQNDFESTMLARIARQSTGTIELALRLDPKPNTLVLNGQTVSRTDYMDLFNWVVERGLLGGAFGAGDGSTTFTLPNFVDRFPAFAAGGTIAVGAIGGANTKALTLAELPIHGHTATTSVTVQQHAAHDHSISGSTGSAGSHDHSGSTNSTGSHGGHSSGNTTVNNGTGGGYGLPNFYNASGGSHSHSVDIGSGGAHTHSFNADVGSAAAMSHTASATTTVNNSGSGAAFDNRPAFIGLLPLIWT